MNTGQPAPHIRRRSLLAAIAGLPLLGRLLRPDPEGSRVLGESSGIDGKLDQLGAQSVSCRVTTIRSWASGGEETVWHLCDPGGEWAGWYRCECCETRMRVPASPCPVCDEWLSGRSDTAWTLADLTGTGEASSS